MPFLVFGGDHLRSTSGIICGSGSFAVQFGDHFRSGDHLRSGIICGAVQHLLLGKYPSKGANDQHRTASAYVSLCLCQSVNQPLPNIWKLICEKKNTNVSSFLRILFRGMPVAGHGKFSGKFLFHRQRKTAKLIDS